MDFSSRIENADKSSADDAESLYNGIISDLNGLKLKDDYIHLKAQVYNNLGQLLYRRVHFNDAVEAYTNAIECDEKLAVAFYNRGTIHYRLGNFDLALKDMQEAVELDPTNPEFLIALENVKKAVI